MKSVSDFIRLANDYLESTDRWARAEKIAIEMGQKGRDAAGLNAVIPGYCSESKAAQKAVLAACEGLPELLESAGVDSRELLRFRELVHVGLDLSATQTMWGALRADLERFAIRQGLPETSPEVLKGGGTRKARRKRGGQKKYNTKGDRKLADNWEAAKRNGTTKLAFARNNGYTRADFDRLLNRVRMRES